MKRYQIKNLRCNLTNLLELYSVSENQATTLIDTMIDADMRGVHTHGLSILPAYINKIENGGFNILTESIICKSTAAFSIVDANNQIGAVSAQKCMQIAIENCKDSGIYSVFCKNANTFGSAYYYSKMAAERNLIGICFCNSPSAMPAWGGNRKLLGTNPFSIAIPAKHFDPIIVDMATSIVAKSKINEIRKNKGTLPEGWAVDENGSPTIDPEKAIKGMILPMAAHKGSAIAMAIDILAGVLSGAGYQNNINRFYSEDNRCMNVGQCFIAIDPMSISDDLFYEKIDEYINEVHNSGENVLYPGEREYIFYNNSLLNGVELHEETVDKLTAILEKNNIFKGLVANEA